MKNLSNSKADLEKKHVAYKKSVQSDTFRIICTAEWSDTYGVWDKLQIYFEFIYLCIFETKY